MVEEEISVQEHTITSCAFIFLGALRTVHLDMTIKRIRASELVSAVFALRRGAAQVNGRDVLSKAGVIHVSLACTVPVHPLAQPAILVVPGISSRGTIKMMILQVAGDAGRCDVVENNAASALPGAADDADGRG